MVPRRANEVELDINLFSSSQIMRDGAEPEGAWPLREPALATSIVAGMLPFPDAALCKRVHLQHIDTAVMRYAGGEECNSPAVRVPTLGKRKATAKPSSARQQRAAGQNVAPSRTRAQAQSSHLQVEQRKQRVVADRASPPAKRLRSSAIKSSTVVQPVQPPDSPATSQQSGRRPRRATLAPLANGVLPATSAGPSAGSEGRKARSGRVQEVPAPAPSSSAAKQAASSRRRPRQTASACGAEEEQTRNTAQQRVHVPVASPVPVSSPDKEEDGPARATRRARLLQQQTG